MSSVLPPQLHTIKERERGGGGWWWLVVVFTLELYLIFMHIVDDSDIVNDVVMMMSSMH